MNHGLAILKDVAAKFDAQPLVTASLAPVNVSHSVNVQPNRVMGFSSNPIPVSQGVVPLRCGTPS